MAIPKLTADVEILSKLGDYPGADNNLSPEQFRAKFDEAATIIKDYLNNTLTNELDQLVDVQALLNAILDTTLTQQDKAANAKAVGDALALKLSLSGGTMTGPINMGSQKITSLAAPTAGTDAANKDYVDGKHRAWTVALTAAGWSANAPYTQMATVQGMLASDRPIYGVVYSDDTETALAQKEAFAMVDDLDTANNVVTFTCFEEKPEADLTIQMEVNR